ncbi:MAG: hypothetical protein WKF40_02215 [Thermoleophilaceae bacterium]
MARLLGQQDRAALGDHHGVHHDRGTAREVQRPVHGVDRGHVAQHADLHRIHADVLGDRPHLVDHRLRRHRVNRGHFPGVLRGDRRDRGHPVGAAPGEGLQVGLDPGATAGV